MNGSRRKPAEKSCPTTSMDDDHHHPLKLHQQHTAALGLELSNPSHHYNSLMGQLFLHCRCGTQTPAATMVNNEQLLKLSEQVSITIHQPTRLASRSCNGVTSKKPLDDDRAGPSHESTEFTAENNNNNNVHGDCNRGTTSTSSSSKKRKVSTILTLCDYMSSSAKNQRFTRTTEQETQASHNTSTSMRVSRVAAVNLSRFKTYSAEDIEEEQRWGVTTKLTLGLEDPWKIKKTLTASDLGNSSRLMLHSDQVHKHILPHLMGEVEVNNNDNGNNNNMREVRVRVWDCDTQSGHQLVLARWQSSKGYVLKEKWTRDFVRRRNLKLGDVVGLYWDASGRPNSMLMHFSVLHRAQQRIC